MFKDADFSSFAAIYVVCGYTDMRLGMDSLAAIIESRYHISLFVPGSMFLFCGHRSNKIKGLVWEGDGFLEYLFQAILILIVFNYLLSPYHLPGNNTREYKKHKHRRQFSFLY